jgi:hypothetical protein
MSSTIRNLVILGVLVVAIPLVGLLPAAIVARWALTAALIVAFLMTVGRIETGRFLGFLIDPSNKVSLSRLQLVGWTVLIISAYSTAALWNVIHEAADPLAIAIPPQVWALMGISVASFIGSPIVKSNKRAAGKMADNAAPEQARSTDIFKAEEVGAENTVDLGKVQMFLFSLIVFVAYGVALGALLLDNAGRNAVVQEFPGLSEGMLALLGLSHTGYLAAKAVPQT